jgi:carboxyl-terminal processing protease
MYSYFKRIHILLIIAFYFSVLGFTANNNKSFRISKSMTVFNSVLRELDLFYVDTLNYDKLLKTAVDNMLAELDPYTVYMPEEETSDLKFMTTGEYGGIGSLIVKKGDYVCISEPYEGMPAQKNDVRAGDLIIEIDGIDVKNYSVSKVSEMLKGQPNTEIKLKLKRYGENKPVIKVFKREKIQINPVSYATVLENNTGYVMLSEFTDKSAFELKNVVSDMVKKNQITSLIIDLRNNGGGLVDEAVKILGYFLPKGTEVVKTKGKNQQIERAYKTPTNPIFADLKLAIITNRSSASASEILAGAIQDLDRGIVVGERTFGKGLVQNIRSVGYGGHLKITTAKYYIPSGRCIQAIDYAHRNEDGSVARVPDSLTTVFNTKNGRKVRDGGGIVPDIVTQDNRKINIAYYIYAQNHYFDFATQYFAKNPTIPKPSEFVLSENDFNAFINYLMEQKFTYTSQTEKYFQELLDVAGYEGLDTIAKAEFDALKAKLLPDITKNIEANKAEISELLSLEIIKRYYFQKGEIEFSLLSDKDLKTTLEILSDENRYNQMLNTKINK